MKESESHSLEIIMLATISVRTYMAYPTYAAGWYSSHNYEHKSHGCNRDESKNCAADYETGRHKPCRRCRTRIYCAKACGNTLQYQDGKKGNPCAGADSQIYAKETGGKTGFVCLYNNVTANFLKKMSTNHIATHGGIKGGPSTYKQLLIGHNKTLDNKKNYSSKGKGFCEQTKNLDQVIHQNGDTCYRYLAKEVNEATAKQKATDFCKSRPSAIKSELCTRENVGKAEYDRLAGVYCDGEGIKDMWCACYNAFKGKCKTNPTAYAGCDGVKSEHDKLIGDIPSDQLSGTVRQQFEERMHCRNNVCKITDGFKPDGADKCEMNLQLCIQDVDVAGHLVKSGINLTCNNKQVTGGDSDNDGDDSDSGGGGGSGGSKRKRMLLIGGGFTGLSMSILCCCLILILILVL